MTQLKYWNGTAWTNALVSIQGLQGTLGLQGTIGAQGTQGVQGTQGTQGNQGTIGTQGLIGPQGIQGITVGYYDGGYSNTVYGGTTALVAGTP